VNHRLWDWPALSGIFPGALPRGLEVEQGIWGKVHGARSDFRWIAATSGFASLGEDLERELTVGIEDRPARFSLWRAHGGVHFAGIGYPSRARDAAGRSGILEKQLLARRVDPAVPAALAALLLLPRVSELDEGTWWGQADVSAWDSDPRFVLDLGASREIPVSEAALDAAVREGISDLQATLATESAENLLADLFNGLLEGRRPVLLPAGEEPLSPEALAVLLLPLEQERAALLSLAGWLPSTRPPGPSLGERWDLVVRPGQAATSSVPPATNPRARRMAEALLAGDPSLLPGARPRKRASIPASLRSAIGKVPVHSDRHARDGDRGGGADQDALPRTLALSEPPAAAGRAWWLLYDLARDPCRFWLEPHDFVPYLDVSDGEGVLMLQTALSWLEALGSSRPGRGAGEQHRAKEDLLRAAILALVPTAAAFDALEPFESDRVPPALYLAAAPSRVWNGARRSLGVGRAAALLDQSRERCAPELRPQIEAWLRRSGGTAAQGAQLLA